MAHFAETLGMSTGQLFGCLALGTGVAGLATAYKRGHITKYMEKKKVQESESSLIPVNKSQSQKVHSLPLEGPNQKQQQQQQKSSSSSSASSSFPNSAACSPPTTSTTTTSTAAVTTAGVAAAAAAATTTAAAAAANNVLNSNNNNNNNGNNNSADPLPLATRVIHKAADILRDTVDWVQTNPKAAITILVLAYGFQHEYRKNIHHARYEEDLEHRLHHRRNNGGKKKSSSSSPKSPASAAAFAASGGEYESESEEGEENQRKYQEEENEEATSSNITSTWDVKARPSHADPSYEKLVQSLPESSIHEFACFLLGGESVSQDASLVKRVRLELLNIAPTKGWTARAIPTSAASNATSVATTATTSTNSNESTKSTNNQGEGQEGEDNKTKILESKSNNSNNKKTSSASPKFLLRFFNHHGEMKRIHPDAEFALDMIIREAESKRVEKHHSQIEEEEARFLK